MANSAILWRRAKCLSFSFSARDFHSDGEKIMFLRPSVQDLFLCSIMEIEGVAFPRAWETFYNTTQTSENLVLEFFFDGEFDFDTNFWLQGQDQGENYDFQGKVV